MIAATDKGICALLLGNDADALTQELHTRFPGARFIADDRAFLEQTKKLAEETSATNDLALDIHGTPFQKQVWTALRAIPTGKLSTYAEIAKKIGKPKAVRAVAQACGANKIAIVIPCHRVVRSDGSLSGYRWGVERKAALLQQEKML